MFQPTLRETLWEKLKKLLFQLRGAEVNCQIRPSSEEDFEKVWTGRSRQRLHFKSQHTAAVDINAFHFKVSFHQLFTAAEILIITFQKLPFRYLYLHIFQLVSDLKIVYVWIGTKEEKRKTRTPF